MLAYTTSQQSLFPSAGSSPELTKKPMKQGPSGTSCSLCEALYVDSFAAETRAVPTVSTELLCAFPYVKA